MNGNSNRNSNGNTNMNNADEIRESVEEIAKMMSEAVGISDYLVMFSNGQFKRTSVCTHTK